MNGRTDNFSVYYCTCIASRGKNRNDDNVNNDHNYKWKTEEWDSLTGRPTNTASIFRGITTMEYYGVWDSKANRKTETVGAVTKNAQLPDFGVWANVVGGRTVVSHVLINFHQRLEANKAGVSIDFHAARFNHPHAVLKTCQSSTCHQKFTYNFIMPSQLW